MTMLRRPLTSIADLKKGSLPKDIRVSVWQRDRIRSSARERRDGPTSRQRCFVSLIRPQFIVQSRIQYMLDQIRHNLSASITISLLGGDLALEMADTIASPWLRHGRLNTSQCFH